MNRENDIALAFHSPRSGIRLGLTVAFGLLGTWLMPSESGFIPHVSAGHHGAALLAWLAAVFIGVILLHRGEHVKTPGRLFAGMGLSLAMTLIRIPPVDDIFDWLSLAKICAINLVLLMAGVSFFGSRVARGSSRPQIRDVVRGIALAVASPLLLFASRPQSESRFAPARAGFVFFLCALASPLLSWGRDYFPHFVWSLVNLDDVILICGSFSRWAWFACGILFLLSPWPEMLRLGERDTPRRPSRNRFLPVVGLAVAGAALLAILRWDIFLAVLAYSLFLLYLEWYAFVLLFMVTPCCRHLRLPKLRSIDSKARMGPFSTVLFLSFALIPLAMWCSPAIRFLASGRIFTARFESSWVGWTLDQSTIQSGCWRFAALGGIASAYIAVARWLCNRDSRMSYWAFTLPSVGLCLCLLSYLTCVFYSLLTYIHALGITPLRAYGLVYGTGCYVLALALLRWAVKRPNEGREAEQPVPG